MDRTTLEALPTVNVEVNGQAAALLIKLMGDLKTEQPLAVLTRALGMLEIVGSMERQLKIQLPDEALAGIQTVEDLLSLVEKKQAAASPGGRPGA